MKIYIKTYLITFFLIFVFKSYSQIENNNRISLIIEYNISSPNSIISTHNKDYYIDQKAVTNYRSSYGSGIAYGIKIERKIHDNISMFISPTYNNGFSSHIDLIKTDTTEYNSFSKSKQYLLCPGLQLELPLKKMSIFMQSGIILPLKVSSQLKIEDFQKNNKINEKWDYSYFFNAGFQAGIGFNLSINKYFKFGTILQAKMLTLTIKEAKLNSYQINNSNQIQSLSKYQTNTVFYEDLNNFSNNSTLNQNYDINKAKDELTKAVSFSTLGLQILFIYQF